MSEESEPLRGKGSQRIETLHREVQGKGAFSLCIVQTVCTQPSLRAIDEMDERDERNSKYLNFAQINGDSIEERLNRLLEIFGKGIPLIEKNLFDVSSRIQHDLT